MQTRSPGFKLLLCILIGLALAIPLFTVYALIWDRQSQSETAQASINAGWGGPQLVAGPVIVIPYRVVQEQNETVDGKSVTKAVEVERMLYVSPERNDVTTTIAPQERRKSIYRSVLYEARVAGVASFALPADLPRFGVRPEALLWDRAEVRMGVLDARGLTKGGTLRANGRTLAVQPGNGPASTGGQGFFAFLPWNGQGQLQVDYQFGMRGSRSLSLVPRGGQTRWSVSSPWPSPSFDGAFLPEQPQISEKGFQARYTIDKLALGQPPVASTDLGAPTEDMSAIGQNGTPRPSYASSESVGAGARAVNVGLIETVNLYSKVSRSVKYGFLFIGFTFLAFLMFDVVGGARVAVAEYLLVGCALVLFFVMLLAFAEVLGFTGAYLVASGAITGLLTAYSAAVLASWLRARVISGLLVGLYGALYVLLNLEAYSLLIGSLMLFAALAAVMWATRRIDWSRVGSDGAAEIEAVDPELAGPSPARVVS